MEKESGIYIPPATPKPEELFSFFQNYYFGFFFFFKNALLVASKSQEQIFNHNLSL